jgi:hypothetical protein
MRSVDAPCGSPESGSTGVDCATCEGALGAVSSASGGVQAASAVEPSAEELDEYSVGKFEADSAKWHLDFAKRRNFFCKPVPLQS